VSEVCAYDCRPANPVAVAPRAARGRRWLPGAGGIWCSINPRWRSETNHYSYCRLQQVTAILQHGRRGGAASRTAAGHGGWLPAAIDATPTSSYPRGYSTRMAGHNKPRVVIMCSREAFGKYTSEPELRRLRSFAHVEHVECRAVAQPAPMQEGLNVMPLSMGSGRGAVAINGGHQGYGAAGEVVVAPGQDPEAATVGHLQGAAGVILAGHAPFLSASILAQLSPRTLRLIGDMEGDRFANRIDMDAAVERGITVSDTTQGTSYPVSEWALALALIALKNAGRDFRQMIGGGSGPGDMTPGRDPHVDTLGREDLWGKSVGLIGCGFIGRRLLELLRPFQTEVFVFDPYLPPEAADMLGFTQTSLEAVMGMDVVISLVPQTPKTDKLIGAKEIALLKPGAAFVNVSHAIADIAFWGWSRQLTRCVWRAGVKGSGGRH
jgi:phosphoglycerate dehydrogenase-like enzyme